MRGKNREKNVDRQVFYNEGAFEKDQWFSFLFQINEIRKASGNKRAEQIEILEIGKGSGFVAAILHEMGYKVTTWDINPNLNPTKVVDIATAAEENFHKTYDIVLCAEVLEHIPFLEFEKCIHNLARLSHRAVILTLPNSLKINRYVLGMNSYTKNILQKTDKKNPIYSGHCWELNSGRRTLNETVSKIVNKYLDIKAEGIMEENVYHYYYICHVKCR